MNYNHGYHAGSYTDVIKHVTLIALITSLHRKPTPYCYLDTHAGFGYYDLFSEFAKKTKEYENGIEKIIRQENPPLLIKNYLDCIHQINNKLCHAKFASLRYYPGSPMIARYFTRPHDRVIACELQSAAYQMLKQTFNGDKSTAIHHQDGFLGLKAFLPPKERRGLVLIDPPYEDSDEFMHIAHSLSIGIKHWSTGIYAIWYPIKDQNSLHHFYQTIKKNIELPALAIELTIYPDLPHHLNGCGMMIINPPWQFESTMYEPLAWLWNALTINAQGGFHIHTLK